MKENKIMTKNYPKYIFLATKGETITKEQAAEVLVRTGAHTITYSSDEGQAILDSVLGRPSSEFTNLKDFNFAQYWDQMDEFYERVQAIGLHTFYHNLLAVPSYQIPESWINWDGVIDGAFQAEKWIAEEEILSDLNNIVEAFPYLNFEVQVFFLNEEMDLVHNVEQQFAVKNGETTIVEPTAPFIEANYFQLFNQKLSKAMKEAIANPEPVDTLGPIELISETVTRLEKQTKESK
jgi:hypothetical protein